MTSQPPSCLSGVVVLERGDRLATALCGALLAELGATVVRLEHGAPRFPDLTAAAAERAVAIARAGKICLASPIPHEHTGEAWARLVARADVVLLTPTGPDDRRFVEEQSAERIVCSVTDYGLDAADDAATGELALQAQGGIMAATGAFGGPPEAVGIPVVEMMTAINAATAVLAALRVFERQGRPQLLDIAAFDGELALFPTFVSSIATGKASGYRLGAGHHLCAPWNAYRTRDGWIQLCSASDDEWQRVLQVIGRGDVAQDERFKDVAGRVAHVIEVDLMVEEWTRRSSSAAAHAAFAGVGVPVGAIRTIPDLIMDSEMARREMVRWEAGAPVVGSIFKFSRCPAVARAAALQDQDLHTVLRRLGPRSARVAAAPGQADRPLAGIRVLEIGPYTAGPLGGRYLSDLGAEVIKIESPGGEISRQWTPQFGDWGGLFVNLNIGKKFLSLDLKKDADREAFLALARSADVVLENLKPGALDRLGIGPRALSSLMPRLVVCSVSGFGADGPARPALDTVVQAEAGLMSLVGGGELPHRVGTSIADQGAAHAAPLAIIAALRHRDLTGDGQIIDLAMYDVVVWLTQLSWPDGRAALRPWQHLAASDGWCFADASEDAIGSIGGPTPSRLTRAELVQRLRRNRIAGASVLEMNEVFTHDAVARRALVCAAGPPGAAIPVTRAPHRLCLTPPRNGRLCAPPNADRRELLGENADTDQPAKS